MALVLVTGATAACSGASVDSGPCGNACSASATCIQTQNGGRCACLPGFEGDGVTCSDVDECLESNGGCSLNATCTNTAGGRGCECRTGFYGDGETCEDIDECASDHGGCSPDALCLNESGSHACECKPGFVGDGETCTDVDECSTAENGGCSPDATCTNIPGSRTCVCRSGYSGDGVTCADVNECLANNGGCSPNGTCTNTPGSRTCACNPGYSGDGQACLDIDECLANNGGCSPNGTCTNIPGSRTCVCNPGYSGDGQTCLDIDECLVSHGGCSPYATCANTPGARTCACGAGYSGDGETCLDVDECLVNNGGCSTNALCTNEPGTRTCACNPGYSGDGETCSDVDECLAGNGGCSPDAACTNTPGSRICACSPGFTGDGVTCVDVDECLANNGGCSPNATCTNTSGSRSCACNSGYAGDGETCVDVDECLANNGGCSPNATCTNISGSRTCACNAGYTGDGLVCTCQQAPVADAGAPFSTTFQQTFSLTATASTGLPGPLSYSWTASADAPALAGSASATPTATATNCGVFTYTVTVTNACGLSSTDSVAVTILGNGPYVSNTTCVANQQCGSVARPWCRLSDGISKTSAGVVYVAGKTWAPYHEQVWMRDGVDVLGGFEPTFTAPPELDPTSTPTQIKATSTAVTWLPGVTARLSGFAISVERPANLPEPWNLDGVSISGSAIATLESVLIQGSPTQTGGSSTAVVSVGSGTGGQLNLRGPSILRAFRASNQSRGILTAPGFDGPVIVENTVVEGANGSTSHGVLHQGSGPLTITGGAVNAGAGTTSTYGIDVTSASGPVLVAGATVRGGSGATAVGIRKSGGQLQIADSVVRGEGIVTSTAVTRGVQCENCTLLDVARSDVVGGTGVNDNLSTVYGIDVKNPALINGAQVVISDSTVTGGTSGSWRAAVHAVNVTARVTGSDVAGSRGNAGGTTAMGIYLSGLQPWMGPHVISGNLYIAGGRPTQAGVVYAVRSDNTAPTTIEDNVRIEGCNGPCGANAIGVSILGDGPFIVSGNQVIAGGAAINYGALEFRGVELSGRTSRAVADVNNNGLIVGNEDPVHRSAAAIGFEGSELDLTLTGNDILGGYSVLPSVSTSPVVEATGLKLHASTNGSALYATGNLIRGGTSWRRQAAVIVGTEANFFRNVVDGCGLVGPNGSPSADCDQSVPGMYQHSIGLAISAPINAVYVNNYIFSGRQGATACVLGCPLNRVYNCGSSWQGLVFESNLCMVTTPQGGVALNLQTSGGPGPYLKINNNILDPGPVAGTALYWYDSWTHPFEFQNNDLVPTADAPNFKGCLLRKMSWSGYCATTPSAVNAEATASYAFQDNVSIPPSYLAPDIYDPSPPGFHLDATCALANLAKPSLAAPTDYDGDPRDTTSAPGPEIGPDECVGP